MIDTLNQDLKAAMLDGDAAVVSTLRMVKSALENARIEKKGELSEEDAIRVLRAQAKQRREAIESFQSGGREAQAEKERAELAVIERYLPEELSDEELEAMAKEAITETGATSMKDMGAVMKVLGPRVAGRADGGRVAAAVRTSLQ